MASRGWNAQGGSDTSRPLRPQAIGIDFGTTNCSVAFAEANGVRLARFVAPQSGGSVGSATGDTTATFRSLLYFHPELRGARRALTPAAGPRGIEAYLQHGSEGRLLQSLKSYLADEGFQGTRIFERHYQLEELAAELARALMRDAGLEALEQATVVVGRPVRFVGAESAEDDALAERRLRAAFAAAGLPNLELELEPLGAARFYESTLDHDELILVADFGGGTSDFSLLEVGPTAQRKGPSRVLGTRGVPLAGDALDARIIDHVVAPRLGRGKRYRSLFGRELTAPAWIYAHLRRWHYLSFLRAPATVRSLEEIRDSAAEPEPFEALLHIVDEELGYALYRSVERTKLLLSNAERAPFRFEESGTCIEAQVSRSDFEGWIAPELERFDEAVQGLLAETGVDARDVSAVFLTGGTSLVPAVRRVFAQRFGEGRLRSGDELVSVAAGLALTAAALPSPR